jgi:hypothetical protein
VLKTVYSGAGGVIWALRRLAAAGLAEAGPDYGGVVEGLAARHREDGAALGGGTGFANGDLGLLMLAYDQAPSAAAADALAQGLTELLGEPTRSWLLGAPGGLSVALAMHRRTGAPRWAELFRRLADDLWADWSWDDAAGCHLWTQDLYGMRVKWLGALHGLAGAAGALLAGRELLAPERRAELEARAAGALAATAQRSGPHANWLLTSDPGALPDWTGNFHLQHCTGAPGMINALADLPADPQSDALLLAGGQLIWDAGPVAKLPGLCHGVPGTGYAFLKLARRTGDEVWLDRARRFAMHAIAQADRGLAEHGRRKWSLWTGDLGLAVYIADCLTGAADFPTLDVF